jgi:hypothetical protein
MTSRRLTNVSRTTRERTTQETGEWFPRPLEVTDIV